MQNNIGIIIFLTVALTIICSGFVYFFIQFMPDRVNAVQCQNEASTISILINDSDNSLIMAGKAMDDDMITIFNDTAIAMNWTNEKEGTKVFLDRIAGLLEIETTTDLITWDKEEFNCRQVSIRF